MQDQDESRFEASARTPPPDRLTWSITEVAQVLGISRASAYEAAHRGELPVRVIGRAESDTAANLVDKVEECLIGLNLEPQQGWAWIAEGTAIAGNFVELLGARIAHVLQTSADLDHVTKAALAMQLAESIAEIAPDFDRGHVLEAVQPDATG